MTEEEKTKAKMEALDASEVEMGQALAAYNAAAALAWARAYINDGGKR